MNLPQDNSIRLVLAGAALLCGIAVLAVLGFMIILSMPVLDAGMLLHILTSPWNPDHQEFGILPMAVGTVYIAGLSLCISFPVSLGAALFIRVTRPGKPGNWLLRLVQLMTAVPTVIYGFVGIFLLVPLVREIFARGSGMSVLTAALMLAMVIAPTMILFFSQSIQRVPQPLVNAADALGATPWQKLAYIILPRAWPGILTGTILALGRAMGDTLIALMLSGNSVMMPSSLLDPARSLTAHIALVIAADFQSVEFKTIFISGILLYLLTGAGILAARHLNPEGRR